VSHQRTWSGSHRPERSTKKRLAVGFVLTTTPSVLVQRTARLLTPFGARVRMRLPIVTENSVKKVQVGLNSPLGALPEELCTPGTARHRVVVEGEKKELFVVENNLKTKTHSKLVC